MTIFNQTTIELRLLCERNRKIALLLIATHLVHNVAVSVEHKIISLKKERKKNLPA